MIVINLKNVRAIQIGEGLVNALSVWCLNVADQTLIYH
jgi:hypothetical protein